MGGLNSTPKAPPADLGNAAAPSTGTAPSVPCTSASGASGTSGGFLDNLASGLFGIGDPVGPGAANTPDDVFDVESVLGNAGLLDRPPGRVFGNDTAAAIHTAQGALNSRHAATPGFTPLKPDGLVNPNGPTHAATRHLAGTPRGRPASPDGLSKLPASLIGDPAAGTETRFGRHPGSRRADDGGGTDEPAACPETADGTKA